MKPLTTNKILHKTDIIRSNPILYSRKGDSCITGRFTSELTEQLSVNPLSAYEYLRAGYVTGADTLYEGIFQLQASEALIQDEDCYRLEREQLFLPTSECCNVAYSKFATHWLDLLQRTINNLIKQSKSRKIIIPLSGGRDSRLIALMLRRANAKNVICFTYGSWNYSETQISREVANSLGYEWHFVPYTPELWKSFVDSELFSSFWSFSERATSLPHIQQILALRELLANEIISPEDILVPGHSGDFLGGSHIPSEWVVKKKTSADEVVKMILKKHFKLWTSEKIKSFNIFPHVQIKELENELYKKILDQVSQFEINNSHDAIRIFEFWDWQERQSKFIANSVREAEFLNLRWALPLWDPEIVSFWSAVPLDQRINNRFYNQFVDELQMPWLGSRKFEFKESVRRQLKVTGLEPYAKFIYHSLSKRLIGRNLQSHPMKWFSIFDDSVIKSNSFPDMEINSLLTLKRIKELL